MSAALVIREMFSLAQWFFDREMCQPTEFDFFLCSHSGTKGTSRSVQYIVLRDDNNFTADELHSLSRITLCYIYAGATDSVSIAPPAHYAHKLAQRARLYLAQSSAAVSSGNATAPAAGGGPKQHPEIKDELKRSRDPGGAAKPPPGLRAKPPTGLGG